MTKNIRLIGVAVPFPFGRAGADCTIEWRDGERIPGIEGTVYAVASYLPENAAHSKELLVLGGLFTVPGAADVRNLATWDGEDWTSLGPFNDRVSALAVYHGRLIVGGRCFFEI